MSASARSASCRYHLACAAPDLAGFLPLGELLRGELLDRAQQPQSRCFLRPPLEHVLVEEPLEHVGVRIRDHLRCLDAASAGEHGQAIEDGPLFIRQQVIAPRDRGPERRLTRVDVSPASQQIEAGGQALEELFDREELQSWGGELQREGEPVEPVADRLHVGTRLDRDAAGRSPRHEELHRIVRIHGRHREFAFRSDLQPLPARHQQGRAGCLRQELGDIGRDLREEMLGVVEHDQGALPPETLRQRLDQRGLRLLRDLQGERDPEQHEITVGERRERHPRDAVREGVCRLGGTLEREARLPRATGTGQGEEGDVIAAEQRGDLFHLLIPADERRGRDGQVRSIEGPDRREVSLAKLVHALGSLQVLEAMIAQIDQREPVCVDLLHRVQRHEDLSPAPGGRDPGGSVDIGAHVPLRGSERGAGVDPDPDPDGPRLQGDGSVSGPFERAARRREREEEGIALRVDLHAAMT